MKFMWLPKCRNPTSLLVSFPFPRLYELKASLFPIYNENKTVIKANKCLGSSCWLSINSSCTLYFFYFSCTIFLQWYKITSRCTMFPQLYQILLLSCTMFFSCTIVRSILEESMSDYRRVHHKRVLTDWSIWDICPLNTEKDNFATCMWEYGLQSKFLLQRLSHSCGLW